MFSYILRRMLLIFPTLLGMTAVVFFVMALSPGGVGGPQLSEEGGMQAEQRKAMLEYYNRRYGLNKPLVVQYLRWLNRVSPLGFAVHETDVFASTTLADGSPSSRRIAQAGDVDFTHPALKAPDLGASWSKGRPVLDLYREALPVTLLLNLLTTPLIYVLAIASGIFAARYRGQWFDTISGVTFIGLWSVPVIWAGVMLIGFLASEQYLRLFPAGGLHDTLASSMSFLPRWGEDGFQRGYLLDMLWHLVLPVVCLAYGGFAFLSKLTRSAVLENLSADFVRTARAKGVSESSVLFRHVFRNSLLPLITVASGLVPALLVGSLVIERIYSLPGMGKLSVDAVFSRDRELVLAGALVGGLMVLFFDLMRDVCYAIADPRVSYE